MKINLIKPKKSKSLKNTYVVKVETMEGDADDYHNFKISTTDVNELREIIIGLTILLAAYPSGRGGYDDYCGSFYEKYVEEELFSNEGISDSIESFSVKFYDENGEDFNVEYEMDEEMQERIKNHDGLTEEEIVTMEFKKEEHA